MRPDTGQSVTIPKDGSNLVQALARVDELADGAEFVQGHNLTAFGLPTSKPRIPARDSYTYPRSTRSGETLWPSPAIPTTTW